MYDLVAIGNPVYDEIITPYVRTEGRVLSGCSTNACLAAKKLGLENVALIGCVVRTTMTSSKPTWHAMVWNCPALKRRRTREVSPHLRYSG